MVLPAPDGIASGSLPQEVAAAREQAPVVTEIGEKAYESLQYALEEPGLVVIDGLARTGKSYAAEAWCAMNHGRARYVQVPSSNDDMSFFRAVALGLGIGCSSQKAQDLRMRIEQVLQTGDLLLVLDEGHYLWPQRNMRKAVPHRINWILTQLVNKEVPVAIVTTPQFTKSQHAVEKQGGWSSEQLVGRITYYETLPTKVSAADLKAVAKFYLPEGDDESIGLLVDYAETSAKYLQAISSTVKRARFLANRNNRSQPTDLDVHTALKQGVVPTDNAIATTLGGTRRRETKTPAKQPQRPVAGLRGINPPEERSGQFAKPCKSFAQHSSRRSEEAFHVKSGAEP